MEDKVLYYAGGTPEQFVISENKNFIIRHTASSYIYYEDSEASNTKDFPEEERRRILKRVMLGNKYSPEEKEKMAHCIFCVKWMPMDNATRYCEKCEYNPRK